MRINQRTHDILTALNESAYPNGPFVMPEILRHWKEDDRAARAGWSHE